MIIDDNILFLYVDYHDFVYDEAPRIIGDIEIEFPELWAVMSPDLRRHLKRWKFSFVQMKEYENRLGLGRGKSQMQPRF